MNQKKHSDNELTKRSMKLTQESRNILQILLTVILLWGVTACSSLQPVADYRTVNVSLPQINPVDIDAGDQSFSGNDYKLRNKRTDQIRLLFVEADETNGDNIPVHLQIISRKKLTYLMQRAGAMVVEPPDEIKKNIRKKEESYHNYLEENRIDGIVSLKFESQDDNHYRALIGLTDPVDNSTMASIDFPLERESSDSDERQAEFYLSRDGYHFLESTNYDRFSLKALTLSSVRKLINSAVTSRIIIMASIPDAVAVLENSKGSKIFTGGLPLDTVLDEGVYRIEVRKKGIRARKREFRVRAGKEQSLFFSWEGDPDNSSLAVYSAPAGLRFSLDDSVIGYTPVFRSTIQAGIYQMELAASEDGKKFKVMQTQELDVHLGEHNDVLYFVDYDMSKNRETLFEESYWQSTAENGTVQVKRQKEGFNLRASSSDENQRVGIVSRMIPSTLNMEMELTLPGKNTPDILFGLMSPSSSVYVEGSEKGYQGLLYKGNSLETTGTAYLPGEKNRQEDRVIRMKFHPDSGMVHAYLNGNKIFEQKAELSSGTRIAILTRAKNADGRLFVKNFSIKSYRP